MASNITGASTSEVKTLSFGGSRTSANTGVGFATAKPGEKPYLTIKPTGKDVFQICPEMRNEFQRILSFLESNDRMSDEIQANLNKLQTTAKETFRSAESLRDDMNRLSGDQIRVDEDLSKVDAQVNDLRKQELNFQHTMERALGGEICQVPFLEYMNCVQHLKARLSALTVNVADARQAMDYLAQTNHEEEWDIRAGRSHSFDALVRQVVQTHSHQYYAVKKAFDSLHKELESLSQKKKTHERVLA